MVKREAYDTLQQRWGGGVSGVIGGGGPVYPGRRIRMSSAVMGTDGPREPREGGIFSSLIAGVTAVARLIVPVIALLVAFIAAYLYSDTPATFLDEFFVGGTSPLPGTWLTWGHVLLPASFLVVHLTNRRYGLSYAAAQVVIAFSLVAGIGVAEAAGPDSVLPALPPVRETIAFAAAFMAALLTAALVFNWTRGLHWWTAPLFGSVWAAAVFAGLFYPAAYGGSGQPFLDYAATHMAVMAGMAILLLIPYWIFRPLVRPLPGFGGY